jgi:hypothetical protein
MPIAPGKKPLHLVRCTMLTGSSESPREDTQVHERIGRSSNMMTIHSTGCAALLAALLLGSSGALAQGASRAVRTIDRAGGVAGTVKQGSRCRSLAPAAWRVIGGRETGDAFDLASADGRLYAGWGIRGVDRAMQPYYGPLFGDPETSALAVASATLQHLGSSGGAQYTGVPKTLGSGFVLRTFSSATHQGVVVYRVYPAPMGFAAGSYVISLRIAAGQRSAWTQGGQHVAVGVASSITCSTMPRTTRASPGDLPRPGDPPGMRQRGGETDELADYNAQLGTQWVHSESTGENYMVDAAAAWNENGPDGPGYYRRAGSSYEKLTPGFRD